MRHINTLAQPPLAATSPPAARPASQNPGSSRASPGLAVGPGNPDDLLRRLAHPQFGGGEKGFSNWELSANRANASRREMIAGGMDENKVLRVLGLSSTVLFDKNDPLSASNRRINIVVLNKRSEEAMLQEDGSATLDVDGETAVGDALAPVPPDAAK